MSLSFRLLDCTFAKPCQYFISLQLDDHKKRLRTKVSDESSRKAGALLPPAGGRWDAALPSAAARAGLRPGDIITSVNRRSIKDMAEFRDYAENADQLLLHVRRGGGALFLLIQ